MKKQLLTLFLMLAASTASAQIVLWNGDDKETGTDGGFWNRADPTVIEDGSNKCLKIKLKENPGGWADEHRMAALPLNGVDFNSLRRITMRIKMAKPHNVMVKLVKDDKYTGDEVRRWFWYGTPGEWQKVVYEYAEGPMSDKITNDNTLLEIYPYEFENEWGQEIFIDDIQLEGPVLKDGAAIRTLADGSLTSKQVEITGSLSKGQYQCTWDGDWHTVGYDDYSLLLSKLSADVCFLNLTGAAVADGDGPQLRTKNPNLLILSPTDFYDTDNVIRWDGEKNITPKMVLDESYPFYTPIDFTATAVQVTRSIKAGINTMCLPFYVGQTEISTNCKIATYTSSTADAVNFTTADHADANVPFLATAVDAAATELNFTDKGVVNTPESFSEPFIGIYVPQSAEGKYGINNDGKFQKGASDATVKSFHALMTTIPAEARSITIDGISTGINNISVKNPIQNIYNLNGVRVDKVGNKGLYIINGKKVIVK